jgi:hypothetical protein
LVVVSFRLQVVLWMECKLEETVILRALDWLPLRYRGIGGWTVLSLAVEHKGKELLQMTSWTESIRRSNLLSPADLIHLKEGKSTAKATRSTHAEQILTNHNLMQMFYVYLLNKEEFCRSMPMPIQRRLCSTSKNRRHYTFGDNKSYFTHRST